MILAISCRRSSCRLGLVTYAGYRPRSALARSSTAAVAVTIRASSARSPPTTAALGRPGRRPRNAASRSRLPPQLDQPEGRPDDDLFLTPTPAHRRHSPPVRSSPGRNADAYFPASADGRAASPRSVPLRDLGPRRPGAKRPRDPGAAELDWPRPDFGSSRVGDGYLFTPSRSANRARRRRRPPFSQISRANPSGIRQWTLLSALRRVPLHRHTNGVRRSLRLRDPRFAEGMLTASPMLNGSPPSFPTSKARSTPVSCAANAAAPASRLRAPPSSLRARSPPPLDCFPAQ